MKRIYLIGVLVVLGAIALGIKTAFETGEKSPIFAAGTIVLDEGLADKVTGIDTLYLVIYDLDSKMPMPYGAVKEKLSQAPQGGPFFDFVITKEKLQVMREDMPMPKNMRVKARLDRDGLAGMDQPGDLIGDLSGIQFGANGVELRISKYVQ